jgi:hypothetical protein
MECPNRRKADDSYRECGRCRDPGHGQGSIGMVPPRESSATTHPRDASTAHAPARLLEIAEPDLAALLAAPEVRLLMRADHVDERAMIATFDAVRSHLCSNSESKHKSLQQDTSSDGDQRCGERRPIPRLLDEQS